MQTETVRVVTELREMLRCGYCKQALPAEHFRPGRGREFGQHPDHRYCPSCGRSIDWFGYKVAS